MQDFKDTLFGNQADICIASWHTPPEIQLLESDVIWKESLVVAAKRGTMVPATKAEFCQLLMSHDIYMFSGNVDALSYAIDLFSKLSIMPSLRFFDNPHLPLLAAESGEALMILPQSVFQRTNSMDLIPIDFCGIETEIQTFVFWKKTNNNSMISKFCYLMQSALTALRV